MNETDRIYDLSTLWKYAAEVFPGFEQRSIDWDRAYSDFLTRVLSAGSDREFHLLLAEFLNLLGDGHTDYRFPTELMQETGYLPFHLIFLDGSYYIREIEASKRDFLSALILCVTGVDVGELLN
ncbi:MAG: hypothetical protein K2N94_00130, partial [Lachnospiraceae bacterium]|nr:hypothetical protein [Lachnospiraceae bacterium]